MSDKFLDIPLPSYMTTGSAGMDLFAAVEDFVVIEPMTAVLIPTNLRIELPAGYEAQVRPRSGLAANHKIMMLNSPGTIDSDFRGEIKVILFNIGERPFTVNRGDRIAQMVVARYAFVEWEESTSIEDTVRGSGGFGSTGR
ncbi:MAG: dUTP diphosphatase [Candidatus Kryptoniota bacterium]